MASSGAITLFVSISKLAEREIAKLLLMGGIFSAILCVDDFFLLHDRYVGPDFLNITCCGIYNPYSFNIADISIFFGVVGIIFFPNSKNQN